MITQKKFPRQSPIIKKIVDLKFVIYFVKPFLHCVQKGRALHRQTSLIGSECKLDSQVVTSTQITKSVSGEDAKGGKKSSDTMGMKHRVDRGVYAFFGSMNPQLAEKTGFNDKDAEAIKGALPKLFENDASSARPEGSMEVLKVVWWQHNCKAGQYSSAKVHRTLKVQPDGRIELSNLDGLIPEEIPGF